MDDSCEVEGMDDSWEVEGMDDSLFVDEEDDLDDPFYYCETNATSSGRGRRFIPGGPQLPNTDGMSVAEKKLTLNAFHEKNPNFSKERRRYTDGLKAQKMKLNRCDGDNEVMVDIVTYTGECCPTLRSMLEVASLPMAVGHTYPNKDIAKLRIAEESNLYGYGFYIVRSDLQRIVATASHEGNSIQIKVLNSLSCSWKVTTYLKNDQPPPTPAPPPTTAALLDDADDDILGGEVGGADDDNKSCEFLYHYSL